MGNYFSTKENDNNGLQNNNKYWKYYGINIPWNIESIPSIDGVNIIGNRGGRETLVAGVEDCSYTLSEYQKKYAITGSDGKLYWKQ